MALRDRLQLARIVGARLRSEFADPDIIPVSYGQSIAWHNVPFQAGVWARWSNAPDLSRMFALDRTLYVTGDQVSTLPV